MRDSFFAHCELVEILCVSISRGSLLYYYKASAIKLITIKFFFSLFTPFFALLFFCFFFCLFFLESYLSLNRSNVSSRNVDPFFRDQYFDFISISFPDTHSELVISSTSTRQIDLRYKKHKNLTSVQYIYRL